LEFRERRSYMSGIEYTVNKVSDEALAEILKNLEEGRAAALSAGRIKMEEAKSEAQKISDHEQRQAEALRRQIIGGAEMAARNKSLQIIEENLNVAFGSAIQKLDASTHSPDYELLLKKMVMEGMEQVGGSDFIVTGNSRDQELLQRVVEQLSKENKAMKVQRGSTRISKSIGGVTVSSGEGYVTFDNTYEARLERLKPSLRKQIAQLFMEEQK
jgi:V/A-type H+/Na+-transporting ATPase subunit E